jgi:uncharacterized cupin superfamily protein
MNPNGKPVLATDIPLRTTKSVYPEPFAIRMQGRTKRQLGNHFGIQKFGINMTHLSPQGESALLHKHSKQEEFIYVLYGHPTLLLGTQEIQMSPGMCMGFGSNGEAHKVVNRSDEPVTYLEIGDRELGDFVEYPDDDLIAEMKSNGKWAFKHKNGSPY